MGVIDLYHRSLIMNALERPRGTTGRDKLD